MITGEKSRNIDLSASCMEPFNPICHVKDRFLVLYDECTGRSQAADGLLWEAVGDALVSYLQVHSGSRHEVAG